MVLCITAVLVPLLLLLSIRSGVIGQIRGELVNNPKARELITIGEPTINPKIIAALRSDPRVAFLAPRTRLLAAGAVLRSEDLMRSVEVDMVPSGPQDPHLGGRWLANGIAVTDRVARQLRIKVGDRVLLIVDRRTQENRLEQVRQKRAVFAIVDYGVTGESLSKVYLPTSFVAASERWREDSKASDFAAAKSLERIESGRRTYSGLRIFAKRIEDVEPIRNRLLRDGIDTESRLDEIRLVSRLDTSMRIFIGALAGLMSIGLIVALASIQWSWVERTRYAYSYLRLLGMRRRDLSLLPVIQALLLVIPAIIISLGLAKIAELLVNRIFAGQLAGVRQISDLNLVDGLLTFGLAVVIAAGGAFLAARTAARVSPIEALRGG
jgi:putative ABC transport system permease protein